MWLLKVCGILSILLIGFVHSEDYEPEETDEVDASVCSEEYESCGSEIKYVNSTQLSSNASEPVDVSAKPVRVRRHCCDGLVCIQGADEEPVASGVTDFCKDPNQSDEKERMFEKWKKSLEMPQDYSYNKK